MSELEKQIFEEIEKHPDPKSLIWDDVNMLAVKTLVDEKKMDPTTVLVQYIDLIAKEKK